MRCFKVVSICLLLLVVTLGAGCAPPVKEKKRFFFPPPPATPRFEYIRFIQSDKDITEKEINWFEDAILGRELPKTLFTDPYDVTTDSRGRIIVSDLSAGQVTILDDANAQIRYFTDGKGNRASFVTPFALDADDLGNVAVTDITKHAVFLYGPDEAQFVRINLDKKSNPVGVAVDAINKRVFVVDSAQHKIHLYDFAGEHLGSWGRRGKGRGEFNFPLDVDLDKDGNVYVLDSLNFRVQVFSGDGEFKTLFGEQGTAPGSFMIPKGLAVSPSGLVFVTDGMAHRFVVFDTTGKYLLTVGGKGRYTNRQVLPGGFYMPRGIDADSGDGVWVIDSLNRTLHNFQYLNEAYLRGNPILPEQAVLPAK